MSSILRNVQTAFQRGIRSLSNSESGMYGFMAPILEQAHNGGFVRIQDYFDPNRQGRLAPDDVAQTAKLVGLYARQFGNSTYVAMNEGMWFSRAMEELPNFTYRSRDKKDRHRIEHIANVLGLEYSYKNFTFSGFKRRQVSQLLAA